MTGGITPRSGNEVYSAFWRLSAFVGFAMAGSIAIYTVKYEPPPGIETPFYLVPSGLAVAVGLGLIALLQLAYGDRPPNVMRAVFLFSYLAAALGMLNLFRFDPREQLFVLLIVGMALGAMMLSVKAAVIMWAVAATAYATISLTSSEGDIGLTQIIVVGLRVAIMLFVAVLIAQLVRNFATSTEAEKERAEELAYHARLLDEVGEAVVVTDPSGNVTTWNHGAELIYGWTRDEMLGKTLDKFLAPRPLDLGPATLPHDPRGPQRGIFLHRAKDGSDVMIEAVEIPLEDKEDSGEITGFLTVGRDVTERLRLEEAARRAEAAEESNRTKNEFLSRMNHELRTPLNAILGFAQLMIMNDATESQKEAAQQIMKGGTHLLTLVDEIRDTTGMEQGAFAIECAAIPLSIAVDEAASLTEFLAQERSVTMSVPAATCSTWILADKVRFRQVLLNLVSNAIKYNREGGEVIITADETEAGYARLTIADTGPGIEPEMLDRLFVPFDRLGAERSEVEGTGLGLVLSKRLVEAMHGRIDVSSEPGVGSSFSVELPVAAAGSFEADIGLLLEESLETVEATRTHKILYIEDQLSNLRLIERVFERRPRVSLVAAMQGQLGVEIARQDPPAMILLDMNLPDISGDEVLKRLRQDPRTQNVPVVVISADATEMTTKRMLAAGAIDYLTKPVDVSRLLELVDAQLATDPRPPESAPSDEPARPAP